MTCDIFIRSYYKDYQFLSYCLRSIQRFATGFRRVVVVVPRHIENGTVFPPTGTMETVFQISEAMDGYMDQQSTKLHADHFSDAEFLLFLDSDCILTRPISPDLVITDKRKPKWPYTPYSSLGKDESQMWKGITEKLIGHSVEQEFMRRHPEIVPRWALQEFRAWVHKIHGMTIERYIMAQPNRDFSEWNALGAYLWHYHHHRIDWQNTDVEMGTVFCHQSYSWGGLNPDLQKHLEAALA